MDSSTEPTETTERAATNTMGGSLLVTLVSIQGTKQFARQLSSIITNNKQLLPLCIGWQGPLGVGKTTLCRELLSCLGYKGVVRSPTYTLIESYRLGDHLQVHHVDAYRLKPHDSEELGLVSYLTPDTLMMIEWAEKINGSIPLDLIGHLDLKPQRTLSLKGDTTKGQAIIQQLKDKVQS